MLLPFYVTILKFIIFGIVQKFYIRVPVKHPVSTCIYDSTRYPNVKRFFKLLLNYVFTEYNLFGRAKYYVYK